MKKVAEREGKYSVLMSVYYKETPAYLRQSIQSMLDQTLPFSDFVLVCDGPLTSELDEVVKWAFKMMGNKLQCVRLEKNQGLGKALRTGTLYCKCPVIARMDSDDVSRPYRCELQMKKLESGDYAIVGGTLQEFREWPGDTGRYRRTPETPGEIRKFIKRRTPFNHAAVMYRKAAVVRAGNYLAFQGFEDYCLWVRMLKLGYEGYNLPETVLDVRIGNGMTSRRGGIAYLRSIIDFQKFLKDEGVIGTGVFIQNCLLRCGVGLMPGTLREKFYRIFLRKEKT